MSGEQDSPLVYYAPDGKGGTYRIPPKKGPIARPPPYEPWRKEWSTPGAKHMHVMWLITWYQQEVDRLTTELNASRAIINHYSDQFCEGWCKVNGGNFEDCGGCSARVYLEKGHHP